LLQQHPLHAYVIFNVTAARKGIDITHLNAIF
jgi:hypothetical protein